MKNRIVRWILLTGFVALIALAILYVFREKPLKVETARVVMDAMHVSITAEGRTRVRDRFVISSPIEGRLGRIDVKEGARVKAGAVLTSITPAPLEIRSERQRQAALEAAEDESSSAQAGVAQARVSLDQAERELRRIAGLVQNGLRPAQELDAARSAASSAQEAVKIAVSVAEAAAHRVEEVRSSLIKSDAQAIAVRSPVDGVVLRIVQQSERVVTSGTPIVELGDPRKLEIVFEVLSNDAMRITPGARVLVKNWREGDALGAAVQMVEPGAFTKISALGVEEQRVNVIATFTDTVSGLGDAYRVDGDIVVWSSPRTLQVPLSALFRVGSEWTVFLADGDRASVRTVKLGQRNDNNAEVLEGLAEGDLVILYPDDRLTPGARIVW